MSDLLIGFIWGYLTMVFMYLFIKYMGGDKDGN